MAAVENSNTFIKPAEIKADKQAPGVNVKRLSANMWAVVFASGDEIFSGLITWAAEQQVRPAHLTAGGVL